MKQIRKERDLSLRDMTVLHGYAETQWRRMERDGVGTTHSLVRIAKTFQVSVADLLDGVGQSFKPSIVTDGQKTGEEKTQPRIATWSENENELRRKEATQRNERSDHSRLPLTKGKLVD